MCGVFGITLDGEAFGAGAGDISPAPLLDANTRRGRDAWGIARAVPGHAFATVRATHAWHSEDHEGELTNMAPGEVCIGNLRAEPTTEWVQDITAEQVQPYIVGDWAIVHNGTIANDKELVERYDLGTPPTRIDSWVIAALLDKGVHLSELPDVLVGSYAILAVNLKQPGVLHYLMNYRPLYRIWTHPYHGRALSSEPMGSRDELLTPYTAGALTSRGLGSYSIRPAKGRERALVVLSGGLDSTVAAQEAVNHGWDVELLHFDYGCRATAQERKAVSDIARFMQVPLTVIDTPIFSNVIKGSRLVGGNEPVAESEAGAEYAHEWVPARNLVMLAIATAYAESHGFTRLVLGANLEEAGAYPDNEPEFLRQFGKLLPFAVGDGKDLNMFTPVGNLMKHEIVALGIDNGAPLHLTWSCYNAGDRHCGHCGPCFMRKTAFEINNATDPVFEEDTHAPQRS